jgi:hypothetical protein
MSGTAARRLVLIVLLAAGAVLLAVAGRGRAAGEVAGPRWPEDDAVFAVDGWTTGPPALQSAWGVVHVSREMRSANGTVVTVLFSTNPSGKGIFGNAEVAFLGTGYAVAPAPAARLGATSPAVPRMAPFKTVLARGPQATWLLHYAYGARGGLVPDAARGWALVLLDAALGRPNDYFMLRVMTRGADPLSPPGPVAAAESAALANTLGGRVSAWYRR